ncbi:hypothetical protein NQ317_011751 [Molorchus minor]|uniref:Uncharacterized protein n=1 Tax=Molorchus minor TaxID=1323400 RepID=A0ABQ9JW58_9CUCU|nr:hypothetical protein NQ317_011751 [Molorchus minor]
MKHNDKLQTKLKAYIQQLEVLEKELHLLHLQNAGFEEQLKYSASQIHCLKVTLQRSKMEYSLEVATLQYKIQATQDTIKESLMAGDVLLKDLGDIKTQFSNISFAVEFSKPENPRNYLSEVIHIGRSCIHLLSKELLTLQTQMVIKEKDMNLGKKLFKKLTANYKKTSRNLPQNLTCCPKKIDESNVAETEKIVSEQKAKILENDLKFVQEKLEKVSKERDEEKSTLLSAIANCETLNDEISEKNKMIEQTKVYINNITAENLALRKQIGGLNSVLSESGAGDVAKELATCQEQILYLQAQYYEILNEKQLHLDEINLLRTENDKIREQQDENYKQLHDQFGNLENMIKDNTSLKQQLETEHQTVLSLQNERKKYLEEKNMLRTIFQHMKSEICRVQKLETAIADISREASKLAMVAEYNKNIGEKLKSEVIEKDQTISHLRSSVEKLNDIQLSLCYELSELCQMKDKLNIRRNTALGDSKKELLESTSTQLRKYEELHKNEKSAMKDLLQNYKTVESQRDDLLKDREFLQKEVTRYKIMYKEQSKKFEVAACLGIEKDREIEQLIAKNCEERKVIDALGTKVTDEVSKYENNIIKLEKLICQLRKDKDDTEDSIKYLQKNIQKLHNDLDESRANEKEAMNVLNKCLLEKEELEREKRYWEKSCTALDQDKDKLVKEINCLNSLCEKVLSDFEASIKASIEKEELFKHEIKESNEIIIRSSKEIDRLNKVVFLKQRDIDNINLELTEVRRNKEDHEERIDSLEGQLKLSQELLNRAEITSDEFSTMQMDYESAKLQLKELEKETDALQKQLEIVTDQRTLDYDFYKKNMDELLRKNEEVQQVSKREIEELKATLVDTTQNLNNERAAYASLSEMHKDVSTKYLDGIEQIMEEKNVRQEIESKLKNVTSSIEKLLIEKCSSYLSTY